MNVLTAIWPKAKKITSEAIAAEIQRAEADLAATHEKLNVVFDGLAVFTEDQHVAAEEKATALRRYSERLQARIDALRVEHETALAVEAEAAKLAAEVAHRKRVEAAHSAVEVEAADLLRSYNEHAATIGDIITRLTEIENEARECGVPGVNTTHRKHPDREATEHREQRLCWMSHDGSVTEAHKNAAGEYTTPTRYHGEPPPRLEMHDIIVSRTTFRPGRYEEGLSEVRLPPAFAGGDWAWPRQ